jgi:hypothetical protein
MAETQTALATNGGAQQLEQRLKPGDQATGMNFTTGENFALLQRVAGVLAASTLVPKEYQQNLPNCIIALNMAQRIGADPLMVMQNLYIVHGRPGWSAQFVIATFNHCGRFSTMRYEWKGEQGNDDWGCRAWAVEHLTGEKLYGAWITWKMVRAEQWDAKNGSKWKTMPEQMFLYRAGAWFVRAYAPEIAMGLQTVEELNDIRAYETAPGVYETKLEGEPLSRAGALTEKLKAEREQRAPDDLPRPPTEMVTREPGEEEEPFRESLSRYRDAFAAATDAVGRNKALATATVYFQSPPDEASDEALTMAAEGLNAVVEEYARPVSNKKK